GRRAAHDGGLRQGAHSEAGLCRVRDVTYNPLVRRRVVAALALLAACNLVLAWILVIQDPSRATDLDLFRDWTHRWLYDGQHLYGSFSSEVDYPPWAIVTFTPVSLLAADWAVTIWGLVNMAAIVTVFVAAGRLTGQPRAVAPPLLAACWGASRS